MFGDLNQEIVGSHTRAEFEELVCAWGWRCWFCGIPVHECVTRAPDRLTEEHLIPLCRGGVDFIANVVPACQRCNEMKGKLTAEEFRLARPGLVRRQAQESTSNTSLGSDPQDVLQQAVEYLKPKLAMDQRPDEYWQQRRALLRRQSAEIRRLNLVRTGQETLPMFGDGAARKLMETEPQTLAFRGMDVDRRKA